LYEWIYVIQKLIDFIDDNVANDLSLAEISKYLGYSSYYCSVQFHHIAGTTIRSYMSKRRLYMATVAMRDTDKRIIDIALEYGYSAQSVLTRAFKDAYGCTPAAYRKNPVPIPLSMNKIYISPEDYIKRGEHIMSNIVEASYFIETITAHKYLGVYKRSMTKNGEIWAGHDCELTTGLVSGINDHHAYITAHTAGWAWKNGERSYFYGVGLDVDQEIEIPEGFELRGIFEESEYIFFTHPPFDYETENDEVMKRVEELAWNFDPTTIGYEWNEDKCQDYQCHYPQGLGYQVLRPVKKIK
jgi:AraC family transcriptional regulator